MLRGLVLSALVTIFAACAQQPAQVRQIQGLPISSPVNLSGSWERDYSRSDDVNDALGRMFRRLNRANQNYGRGDNSTRGGYAPLMSTRDVNSVLSLARLAELVTRPPVLTIKQGERELRVEREGDFDMLCEFHAGLAHGVENTYGVEVCGWQGQQFISRLVLPDGLVVSHRFSIAPDQQNLHVATTVSQSGTPVPFTLNRFYTRFEPLPDRDNCIETLSRKRVCTRGSP
ncbi:MAG: hypothetical protein KJO35_09030 [Gammaproteobacteria bacterium]|nr:hypothetical protein [Gammaproteobacteria bacterium]